MNLFKILINKSMIWVACLSMILSACDSGNKSTSEEDSQEPEAKVKETSAQPVAPGVQVYSVRDALKEDFEGTFKKVADIGYKNIEAFGLGKDGMIYGMTPAEYKEVADKYGLNIVSTHATYFMPEDADAIIEAAKILDVKYVVVPYLGEEYRDYDAVAANLNEVGKKFEGTGIRLAYHNHAFEFEPMEDGRIPEEVLIKGTNPELVTFQADLYWVVKGGTDPMELIKKYPGRFSLFHVKDANDALEQTTVGTGIIDFETILGAKDISGNQYYFVEDERTDDPFMNIEKALDHLSTIEI
ncbi:MAG TPA: sugar phosphate isomerase/epimerase family protein [Cyclobacteriaceae bacterium]